MRAARHELYLGMNEEEKGLRCAKIGDCGLGSAKANARRFVNHADALSQKKAPYLVDLGIPQGAILNLGLRLALIEQTHAVVAIAKLLHADAGLGTDDSVNTTDLVGDLPGHLEHGDFQHF